MFGCIIIIHDCIIQSINHIDVINIKDFILRVIIDFVIIFTFRKG